LSIDIGANVGLWAKDLTNFFSKTVCFEPNLDCVECLKKNILLQKSAIYQVALGSKNEQKLFFQPNNSGASSFVNKTGRRYDKEGNKIWGKFSNEVNTKLIEIKTLDSYNFTNINFIKIDVQGFEYEVLKGAYQTLKNSSPVICVEESEPENSKSIKFLKDNNYEIVDRKGEDFIFKKKNELLITF